MVTLEMFERYSTCSHSKFINKSIVNPPSVFGLLKTTLEKSLAEKRTPENNKNHLVLSLSTFRVLPRICIGI